MFEQALLESAHHLPEARRTCSTAVSLLLQSAALATFVIVPILSTQVAPRLQERPPIFLPELTPAPVIESSGMEAVSTASSVSVLRQPRSINQLDRTQPDLDTVPTSLHAVGTSQDDVSLSILISGSGHQVYHESDELKKSPVISVLEQGVVISRVQPLYPQLAIANRIQGTVHLNALITPGGNLEELHVLSGHPMLAQAAIDAVRQWRFRPYILNGKSIEVQTEVIVNFRLD